MPRKKFTDAMGCSPMTVYKRGRQLGLKVSAPTSKVEDAELWKAFKAGDQTAANTLATKYVPLCRHIVERIRGALPPGVDHDDLFSAALDGLLQAMQKFDPGQGNKFVTYAPFRIRGAVLDEIRALDFVPRLTRAKQREFEAAKEHCANEFGREPTEEEVLEALGWGPADAKRAEIRNVGSLDAVRYETDNGRPTTTVDQYVASPERDHRAATEIEHMTRGIGFEARVVMWFYFAFGYTLKEIAAMVFLSESRVSQIMSQGLSQLREKGRGHYRTEGATK